MPNKVPNKVIDVDFGPCYILDVKETSMFDSKQARFLVEYEDGCRMVVSQCYLKVDLNTI